MSQATDPVLEDLAPADHAAEQPDQPGYVPKPHQSPLMGLTLDGDRHDPSVLAALTGKALFATPGIDAKGEPVLHAFTARPALSEHLSLTAFEEVGVSNPDSLSPVSRYFEHAGNGGDELQNNPGRAWRDLTQVSRGFLGTSDWNDFISSVDWCRWDISLFEHVGFGGSELYLRAGRSYKNLTDFGWNDRASSTVNWGRRF